MSATYVIEVKNTVPQEIVKVTVLNRPWGGSKEFEKMFGNKIDERKQVYFNFCSLKNGNIVEVVSKKLDPGVFEVEIDSGGSQLTNPNVALLNLEKVMKLYFPDDLFVYKKGFDTFKHPEVKKDFTYEFGNINPRTGNWVRTNPNEGKYIGFWFGNRVPLKVNDDKYLKQRVVKRFKLKIPVPLSRKYREGQFIIFERNKDIERINDLYQ